MGDSRIASSLSLVNTLANVLLSTSAISAFEVIGFPWSEMGEPMVALIAFLLLTYLKKYFLLRFQKAPTLHSSSYFALLINLFKFLLDST